MQPMTEQAMLSIAEKKRSRIAIAAFFFLSGINFASFTSRIPDLQVQLHLSNAALGTVLAALPVGLFASMPFAGWLIHLFGNKKVLFFNAFVYTLMLYMLSWVNSGMMLFLNLFFFGASRTLFNVSVNALAVELQRQYDRSIVNTFHGVWSAAALVGAAFSSWMIAQHVTMHMHYLIVTILCIGMIVYFIQPITSSPRSESVRRGFQRPKGAYLILGVMAFCVMFCEGTMNDWSGVYMRQIGKVDEHMITLGYVSYLLAMLTGRFLGDGLVQKTGVVRLLQICGILTFIGFTMLIFSTTFWALLLGFLVIGLGVSCVVPMIFVMTSRISTLQAGAVISMVSSVGYLGFLSGPPLIGYVSDFTNLRYAFILCLCCALGLLLLLRTKPIEQS